MADAAQISRRNATKVCALYEAGSMAVCRAGEKVAVHISTTSGEIIVRISLRDFVVGCRGARDANGNPLPVAEQLDEQQRRRLDTPVPGIPDVPRRIGISASRAEKCEAAWKIYVEQETFTQGDAAVKAGISTPSFNAWIREHHEAEADAIIASRRPLRWLMRQKKEKAVA